MERRPWPPVRLSASPFAGLANVMSAFSDAVETRRLFVLLPFSMIAGLVLYAVLPDEPAVLIFIIGSLTSLVSLIAAFVG